jgi:hypothetical protein
MRQAHRLTGREMTYVNVTQCASDELLEKYSLGRVTDNIELAFIEEHLLLCHTCQDRLIDTDVYIKTICAAFSTFHIEAVSMQAVHASSEGSIYLWAIESEQGLWMARISGCESAGEYVFTSCSDAFDHNASAFCKLFPQHMCSTGCKQISPQ